MLRRHLGFTPDEVRSMPWWEQLMWIEMLAEEFSPGHGEEHADGPGGFDSEDHGGASVKTTNDAEAAGFTVRSVV